MRTVAGMRTAALILTLASGPLAIEAVAQTAALPESAKLEANIPYDRHPQTVLDVIAPKQTAREKYPGVVYIHGGGWVGGSKDAVLDRVLPWVERGFVVANVEYRVADVAPAPAAAQDVLKAAEWFRKNAKRWNVDDDRIVVTGTSAGAHLALITGLAPKSAKIGSPVEVAAIVNFWGITDVEDIVGGPNVREFGTKWLAASAERDELARRLSPVTYARKNVPPVLSIHGTADETVPYEHGVTLTKALRDAGADAEMISVPGGAHPVAMDIMQSVYPQIWEFLQRRGILK